MTKKLTAKQLKMLRGFSHPDLLEQLIELMNIHPEVQKIIVSQWLAEPADQIKALAKNYTRLFKKITHRTQFYRYHETDRFFEQFDIDINQPLKALASRCPRDALKLTYKIIDEFDTLCSHMDTSSGSWHDCYLALYNALLTALTQLAPSAHEDAINIVFNLSQSDPLFQWEHLIHKDGRIAKTLLINLRDNLLVHQLLNDAFILSVMLHDIPSAQVLYDEQASILSIKYQLELAKLFIEELDTMRAIGMLHDIQSKIRSHEDEYKQWTELMSIAYRDNGEIVKAKAVIIDSFKRMPNFYYWQLYLKVCQAPQDLPDFIHIIKEYGTHHLIHFLFELNDYQAINALFEEQVDNISDIVNLLDLSFCRKLSTTLNQNGYHLIAILLRRCLAEKIIIKAQSRYYKYAVSDIKKQIDYAIEMDDEKMVNDSLNWIVALYHAHSRKTSLWSEIKEKIPQLNFSL